MGRTGMGNSQLSAIGDLRLLDFTSL